jgi:hypothetical protein
MKRVSATTGLLILLIIVCTTDGKAQDDISLEGNEHLNTNLAVNITAPTNPLSNFAKVGGGLVAGAGYNINKHHAFIGEFMWSRLGGSDAALANVRNALGIQDVHGHANLFTVTANYRLEFQGHTTGFYLIGGGGWYHRTASIQTHVATGSSISCTPTFLWWGFECSNGTVVSNQTLASTTVDSLGGNAGAGLTFKVAEPRYRFYIEARYHYSPSRTVKTEMIPVTIGIRF